MHVLEVPWENVDIFLFVLTLTPGVVIFILKQVFLNDFILLDFTFSDVSFTT